MFKIKNIYIICSFLLNVFSNKIFAKENYFDNQRKKNILSILNYYFY